MNRAAVLVTLMVAVAAWACSDRTIPPPAGGDGSVAIQPDATGGQPDAAGGNPDAAGGNPDAAGGNPDASSLMCNGVNAGTRGVTQVVRQENVPTAMGGPIVPTRYVLLERILYVGPGGSTTPQPGMRFSTIQFGATSFDMAYRVEAPGRLEVSAVSGTWSSTDPTLTIAETCPDVQTTMTPFSSDGIHVTLYPPGTTGEALVFEEQ